MTPGLRRLEAQQKAIKQAQAAGAGSAGKPTPPSDPTLHRHLSTLLAAIEDSVALISKFSSASCFSRLWNKSDYSSDFASLHALLSQAQADLGFGLQVEQLFSAQRDAEDSRADLADIRRLQERIVEQLEAGFEAQAVGQAQICNHIVAKFASQAEKINAVLKFQQRLERELKQAEMRSKEPDAIVVPAASVSASSSSSSPSLLLLSPSSRFRRFAVDTSV